MMDTCISLSVTRLRLRCANAAERIEVLYGVEILGAQGTLC